MISRVLILSFCLVFNCFCQEIITDDDFQNKEGIILIEIWEAWNKPNECKWLHEIKNAEIFRMKARTQVAIKNGVVSLPTIILYENGYKVEKWEADLSFQLPERYKNQIQRSIDDLNISNF